MTTTFPTASLLRRVAAMIYDSLLVFALLMLAGLPAVLFSGTQGSFLNSPWYTLYLYCVVFLFFGWFWTRGGQTLGMRSWRLQIIRDDGLRLRWDQALYRYLVATLSLCLFGAGFIWILFNKQGLAWHDLATGTRIIVKPKLGKRPQK